MIASSLVLDSLDITTSLKGKGRFPHMFDLWSASLTPCSSTNFPASGLENLSSLFFFFFFKSSNLLPKDLKGKQCLSCNWAMR